MKHPRSRFGLFILLALFMLAFSLTVASATSHEGGRMTVEDIEFLGIVTYDVNFEFAGTPVGGLSGITYDAARGVYYAVSDDRSERAPARYYTLDIELSVLNAAETVTVDLFVVLTFDLGGPEEKHWSALAGSGWAEGLLHYDTDVEIESGHDETTQILSATLPSDVPMYATISRSASR